MLSLDVTDRNIRIIKGVENNGKIRISAAATLLLEEAVIINGHCKDVPRLATLINQTLKSNRMSDKEAIISISSNLTIFKELHIPKAKDAEFLRMVRGEMQQSMGIDNQYGISYIVVGEVEEEGRTVQKVLATACPYEVVDSYRKVFAMLGIALKSVIVGCNCITKVLLADNKVKAKMPLLAVQIDNNFISLNLYEDSQLTFSRFASIDPSDYDNSEDYVFEAVNENIFRMLQFQRNRNPQSPIENVIFYGDTHEYVRLTNALEQMEIKTGLINVPPQVHGYENLEFAVYANAIGAMFKRNKETEHINLLETMEFGSVVVEKIKSDKSFPIVAVTAVAVTVVILGGIYFALFLRNQGIIDETTEYKNHVESVEVKEKILEFDRRTAMKTQVLQYLQSVENANDAFISKPILTSECYKKLDEAITKVNTDLGYPNILTKSKGFVFESSYADGVLTATIRFPGMLGVPTQPLVNVSNEKCAHMLVEELNKLNYFENVSYTGFKRALLEDVDDKLEPAQPASKSVYVEFILTMSLKGDKDNKLVIPDPEAAETTSEGGAE